MLIFITNHFSCHMTFSHPPVQFLSVIICLCWHYMFCHGCCIFATIVLADNDIVDNVVADLVYADIIFASFCWHCIWWHCLSLPCLCWFLSFVTLSLPLKVGVAIVFANFVCWHSFSIVFVDIVFAAQVLVYLCSHCLVLSCCYFVC